MYMSKLRKHFIWVNTITGLGITWKSQSKNKQTNKQTNLNHTWHQYRALQ